MRGLAVPAGGRRSAPLRRHGPRLLPDPPRRAAGLRRGVRRGRRRRRSSSTTATSATRPARTRSASASPSSAEDWRAAIAHARSLDGVDPDRIVLWGYSFAGGHIVESAADGPAHRRRARSCARSSTGWPGCSARRRPLSAWILPRAVADRVGAPRPHPRHRPPGEKRRDDPARRVRRLHPRPSGRVAVAQRDRPGRLPHRRALPARCARPSSWHARVGRPRRARHLACRPRPCAGSPTRAPKGELTAYDLDHFEPLIGDAPQRIAADQVAFLERAGPGRYLTLTDPVMPSCTSHTSEIVPFFLALKAKVPDFWNGDSAVAAPGGLDVVGVLALPDELQLRALRDGLGLRGEDVVLDGDADGLRVGRGGAGGEDRGRGEAGEDAVTGHARHATRRRRSSRPRRARRGR